MHGRTLAPFACALHLATSGSPDRPDRTSAFVCSPTPERTRAWPRRRLPAPRVARDRNVDTPTELGLSPQVQRRARRLSGGPPMSAPARGGERQSDRECALRDWPHELQDVGAGMDTGRAGRCGRRSCVLLHGYSGRVAYGGGSGQPWECRRRVPAQGRRIASGSVCAVAVGDGVEGCLGSQSMSG
jgi:hypothetical protein